MLDIGWNLLFTVINLVILFVAMKIFLFKPVRNIIAKRQEEADAARTEAETMAAEAKQTKAEYEKALARTAAEREEVLATARRLADEESEKILADAREEAKDIREAAEDEGERRKEGSRQGDCRHGCGCDCESDGGHRRFRPVRCFP